MKTRLIIIGAIALLLSGCADSTASKYLSTVVYDGHHFILFNGGSYDGGIVHHPDCPCHKRPTP